MPYFEIKPLALEHLKSCDAKLASAIERIGIIQREIETDFFKALLHSIIGQQISTKAQITICQRLDLLLAKQLELASQDQQDQPKITPEQVLAIPLQELQGIGISWRKAEYLNQIALAFSSGQIDLAKIVTLADVELINTLIKLPGVGRWTAEMLMIFSLQRQNVFSFNDLAIHRGLRMLYQQRQITKTEFTAYYNLYSPYASTASLYLWAIAGGALPELNDPLKESKTKAKSIKSKSVKEEAGKTKILKETTKK